MRVDIAQRQMGELIVDPVAQIAHDGLSYARHDIVLNIAQQRAQAVDAENCQQDFLYLRKIEAAARKLDIRLLLYRVNYVAEEQRPRDGQHRADNARYEHDCQAGDKGLE